MVQLKQISFISILVFSFSIFTTKVAHSQGSNDELGTQVNLLFGLTQPMIDGFNAELNVFHNRFVFDYSHGVSLNLSGEAAPTILSDVGLEAHIPYTTGFGLGYRVNNWLNIRFEPKWHKFEVMYANESQNNLISTYNTTTLGIGVYTVWKPFKKKDNLLKGIMIAPSVRYWYNVSSSLENNELAYYNTVTNQEEVHEALNIGLNNTPLIINISVGYSLDLK